MMIGELAKAVGVPSQTIRFYERTGLLPAPSRATNGYRTYGTSMIARVRFIRTAQAAGLTLAEIGTIVDLRDEGEPPCSHVVALLGHKLDTVQARRRELAVVESELEQLIDRGHRLDPAQCTDADVCQILAEST